MAQPKLRKAAAKPKASKPDLPPATTAALLALTGLAPTVAQPKISKPKRARTSSVAGPHQPSAPSNTAGTRSLPAPLPQPDIEDEDADAADICADIADATDSDSDVDRLTMMLEPDGARAALGISEEAIDTGLQSDATAVHALFAPTSMADLSVDASVAEAHDAAISAAADMVCEVVAGAGAKSFHEDTPCPEALPASSSSSSLGSAGRQVLNHQEDLAAHAHVVAGSHVNISAHAMQSQQLPPRPVFLPQLPLQPAAAVPASVGAPAAVQPPPIAYNALSHGGYICLPDGTRVARITEFGPDTTLKNRSIRCWELGSLWVEMGCMVCSH